MGYMSHNAIIISSVFDDKIEAAHAKAVTVFGSRMVSPILPAVTNGVRSFLVGPDGSKEGWTESNNADDMREEFRTWLRAQVYEDGSTALDWVEVQYGNDDHETIIVDDSDADRRARNKP
jgi:hypothetical protein